MVDSIVARILVGEGKIVVAVLDKLDDCTFVGRIVVVVDKLAVVVGIFVVDRIVVGEDMIVVD